MPIALANLGFDTIVVDPDARTLLGRRAGNEWDFFDYGRWGVRTERAGIEDSVFTPASLEVAVSISVIEHLAAEQGRTFWVRTPRRRTCRRWVVRTDGRPTFRFRLLVESGRASNRVAGRPRSHRGRGRRSRSGRVAPQSQRALSNRTGAPRRGPRVCTRGTYLALCPKGLSVIRPARTIGRRRATPRVGRAPAAAARVGVRDG